MADQISSLTVQVNTQGAEQARAALAKLGINAKAAESAAKKYRSETEKVAQAQDNLATSQNKANKAVKGAEEAYRSGRGGFRAMRGATQQLSYQLQDVAVQAQMGTDGLRILAQQGPQILSIFGPAGAITGALIAFGALFASVLIPGIEEAEEEVDNLADTLDRLANITDRTKLGLFALGDEFVKLARRSKALADIEISVSMTKARRALEQEMGKIGAALDVSGVLDENTETFKRYNDRVDGVVKSVNDASDVSINFIGKMVSLGNSLGLTGRQASDLVLAFKEFQSSRTPSALNNLNTIVRNLFSQAKDQEKFANFMETFGNSARGIYSATDALADFEAAQKQLASGDFKSSGELDIERQEAESLDRRLFRKMAYNNRVLDQAQKNAAQQQKVESDLQDFLNKEEARNAQVRSDNQRKADEMMARARADDAVVFARKQRMLLELEQAEQLLDEQEFNEFRKAVTAEFYEWKAQYEQRQREQAALELARELERQKNYLDKWKEQTAMALQDTSIMAVQMATSFEQSMGNAFEGFLTGTMNAKEAFAEFVRGMLKSFLSAISQMIAKRIALAVVEKVTGTKAAAADAAYTGAISQSQVFMAGLNAFTSTAAIPVVGPALAPEAAAAAMAVAQAFATGATTMAAAGIAAKGSRATGGQVLGGESYLVGERGPELLTMGTSGRIASNDQLKKAIGGGESIQIVNNIDARGADASVDMKIRSAVEQSSQATIAVIQDLMRRRRFV